jgi:AraC-like DNA-binding protein
MVFSTDDKILIKNLYLIKGYGPQKLIREFPEKKWNRHSVVSLLRRIRKTGSVERRKGSGRPKSARTTDNVSNVEDLVQSQDDKPQTHLSVRQISAETGIHRSSVSRIIHKDLTLKCLKKRRAQELTVANQHVRFQRAKRLLQLYKEDQVNFIWFTDEKIFTVASPKNPQNDRVYVPSDVKKKEVKRVAYHFHIVTVSHLISDLVHLLLVTGFKSDNNVNQEMHNAFIT